MPNQSKNIRRLAEWANLPYSQDRDSNLVYAKINETWILWNPFTSLDHAAMLEDEVKRRGLQEIYSETLDTIVRRDGKLYWIFNLITAKAAQRAEAILRLMEGGKDERLLLETR